MKNFQFESITYDSNERIRLLVDGQKVLCGGNDER